MNATLLVLAALWFQRSLPPAPVEPAGLGRVSNAAAAVARPVTLGALRAEPGRYLDQEVRFVFQFRALIEDWNPYLSRFEPSRWLALEVWPDEVFTWDRGAFDAPARRLFVRRGGGFEPLARRAHVYQRFEARARVREAFQGEPWLELIELVPLEGEVGEGTILHVTRARELLFEGQFELALEQYERARSAPLPPHALARVLEEMRVVREARTRAGEGGKGATQTETLPIRGLTSPRPPS